MAWSQTPTNMRNVLADPPSGSCLSKTSNLLITNSRVLPSPGIAQSASIRYLTDTMPSSSGSHVFGQDWHGHLDVCCEDEYNAACCAMHDGHALWLMAIAGYCEVNGVLDHCGIEEVGEANNTSDPQVVEKAGP